ncbi:MAG TPA: hypothetical protein VGA38_07115, partial [Candidatus Limnocylindria bacterium]
MSAIELVAWTTQVLFVALAVFSIYSALRRPRAATVDAALFFGALAGVILQSRLAAIFGWTGSELASDITSILLVTVAYFLLRLANDFAKVPRLALRLAEAGLAAVA